MAFTYIVHIVAGTLALGAGYTALWSAKGAVVHRKSGMVFVYAMLVMCIAGLLMAVIRGAAPAVNVPAALLTSYLVVTSLMTVRPPAMGSRWLEPCLMAIAMMVGFTCLGFGYEAVTSPNGRGRDGMPAFPYIMFGVVGTLGGMLDLRMILRGGVTGMSRLARHLWRMCFALFIAALSFFLGQSDEFPQALRIVPLLALPVVAVLVTMFYWLWRVRGRRPFHGGARVVASRAA